MNKSEKFWNRLFNNYDKQAKYKAYKLIIDKSKKHLKTNDIILDFGCAFEDVEKVLNRMSELLKSGGLIITSIACLKEKRAFIEILSGSLIFIFKELRILPYLKKF